MLMSMNEIGQSTRRTFVSRAVAGAAATTLLSSSASAAAGLVTGNLSHRKPAEPLIVLYIRFKPKPGQFEEFKRHLYALIDVMAHEKAYVNTIVHNDPDHPDEIVLYETWRGTRESWIAEEFPKPYRAPYEEGVKDMLESRQVSWLVPADIWGKQ
jgi:quinol monooxygenase YgiN